MSEDIYAQPDMTQKVRLNRGEMEDRGEMEENVMEMEEKVVETDENVVDIYASAGSLRGPDPDSKVDDATPENTAVDQHSGAGSPTWIRPAAVSLGLLCVLLLAVIIGQGVYKTRVTKERDELLKQNETLTREMYQLVTRNENLTREMNQLVTRNENLTREREDLQKRFCESLIFNGWKKFGCSLYYVSTEKNDWESGRTDCRSRGADLVLINSKKEQDFLSTFKEKYMWIGLRVVKGAWTWMDGTPLNTSYWASGQGSAPGDHDCVYIEKDTVKGWFGYMCSYSTNWICEKEICC